MLMAPFLSALVLWPQVWQMKTDCFGPIPILHFFVPNRGSCYSLSVGRSSLDKPVDCFKDAITSSIVFTWPIGDSFHPLSHLSNQFPEPPRCPVRMLDTDPEVKPVSPCIAIGFLQLGQTSKSDNATLWTPSVANALIVSNSILSQSLLRRAKASFSSSSLLNQTSTVTPLTSLLRRTPRGNFRSVSAVTFFALYFDLLNFVENF